MPMVPVKCIQVSTKNGRILNGSGFLVAGKTAADYDKNPVEVDARGFATPNALFPLFWDAAAIYPVVENAGNLYCSAPPGDYLFLKSKPGGLWKAHDVSISEAQETLEVVIRMKVTSRGVLEDIKAGKYLFFGSGTHAGSIEEVVTPVSIEDKRTARGILSAAKMSVDAVEGGDWQETYRIDDSDALEGKADITEAIVGAANVGRAVMPYSPNMPEMHDLRVVEPKPEVKPSPDFSALKRASMPGIDADEKDIIRAAREAAARFGAGPLSSGDKETHTRERRKSRIKRPITSSVSRR